MESLKPKLVRRGLFVIFSCKIGHTGSAVGGLVVGGSSVVVSNEWFGGAVDVSDIKAQRDDCILCRINEKYRTEI